MYLFRRNFQRLVRVFKETEAEQKKSLLLFASAISLYICSLFLRYAIIKKICEGKRCFNLSLCSASVL